MITITIKGRPVVSAVLTELVEKVPVIGELGPEILITTSESDTGPEVLTRTDKPKKARK